MGFDPYMQPPHIQFFEKLLLYLNKTLTYIQRTIFALLGLFLPLSVGWYNHNINYLSSFNESELQLIAAHFNMPVYKFIYVYNNFAIAISAIL
ncbi:hypothetical protein N752_01065 [Desulforamulus aquiferis]|nr:hypothetical protein N752_01065 [Desulforamulus aquiferis]